MTAAAHKLRWDLIVSFVFLALSGALIAASALYLATIIYGIYVGHVLPTATIFSLAAQATEPLVELEPRAGMALLVIAGFGVAAAWIGAWDSAWRRAVRRTEVTLQRLWFWCGLPVLVCLLLFSVSSGGWSGHFRPADLNYMSLAGLVPYSDANNYFTAALEQSIHGQWNNVAARRPLAATFREVSIFIGQATSAWNIYIGTILVQLGAIAVMLYLAARSLALWRGIWVAIGFVGLVYPLARMFLPTVMTEPLALIWTLFALLFFCEALRLSSVPHALIALLALVLALWMRMGSLLTPPMLVLWLALGFAAGIGPRIRLFVLGCVAITAVLGVNALVSLLFGPPGVTTGGNFAWVLCGLTIGSDWAACDLQYAAQLRALPDEDSQALFLLLIAWENFRQRPEILFKALAANLREYLFGFPRFLMGGNVSVMRLMAAGAATLVFAAGLIHVMTVRASKTERWFWLLVFVSAALSASIIIGGGRRALFVTDVLIAGLFAFGFSTPTVVVMRNAAIPLWRWQTGAGVIAAAIALYFAVPAFSHGMGKREMASHPPIKTSLIDEHAVAGGRRLSGFLVVADEESLPTDVPALHLSRFTKLIEQTGLEREFGPFLQGLSGRTPFAFVTGVRFDAREQQLLYIAPPEMLMRREVWAWRLQLKPLQEKPSTILREVVTAEALP